MKTILVLACLVVLLAGASAAGAVNLYVNGQLVDMHPGVGMHHDRAYGPLRDMATAMGATVDYHTGDSHAGVSRGNKSVKLSIWSDRIVGGHIMVRVRQMAEGLGGTVAWNGDMTRIDVTLPPVS
jgi:hypothetical protein